jgi:hypothetical protein
MSYPIIARARRAGSSLIGAALIAGALIAGTPGPGYGPALAAGAPLPVESAEQDAGKPDDNLDMNALRERLRVLGEALRNAIEDASRAIKREDDPLAAGKGGLGALAPRMDGRDPRAVYGPKGPSVRSVKALLNYRLVLLGNDRLTAGRIFERDRRIIAEVVTRKEKALVTRYMINKRTGVWVPER